MPASSEPLRTELIPTPAGAARAIFSSAHKPDGADRSGEPGAVFVVGHGAGGGFGARDLVAVRRALPPRGIEVVEIEQPWKVAGKKVATAPPQLDLAWLAAVPAVLDILDTLDTRGARGPLILGGRSAGARVACRTATRLGAAGVVALAFPLHLPGKPERSRLDELLGAGVPTLVVQGERDPFGRPEEFPAAEFRLCPVPAADHGFAVPKSAALTQREAIAVLVSAVTGWLDELLAGAGGNRGGDAAVDGGSTADWRR